VKAVLKGTFIAMHDNIKKTKPKPKQNKTEGWWSGSNGSDTGVVSSCLGMSWLDQELTAKANTKFIERITKYPDGWDLMKKLSQRKAEV
jgi:hypothetical protein